MSCSDIEVLVSSDGKPAEPEPIGVEAISCAKEKSRHCHYFNFFARGGKTLETSTRRVTSTDKLAPPSCLCSPRSQTVA